MRRKMKNASIELLENEKGVGIINACLRLKMMSHDKVQFELNGEEGTGGVGSDTPAIYRK